MVTWGYIIYLPCLLWEMGNNNIYEHQMLYLSGWHMLYVLRFPGNLNI